MNLWVTDDVTCQVKGEMFVLVGSMDAEPKMKPAHFPRGGARAAGIFCSEAEPISFPGTRDLYASASLVGNRVVLALLGELIALCADKEGK